MSRDQRRAVADRIARRRKAGAAIPRELEDRDWSVGIPPIGHFRKSRLTVCTPWVRYTSLREKSDPISYSDLPPCDRRRLDADPGARTRRTRFVSSTRQTTERVEVTP